MTFSPFTNLVKSPLCSSVLLASSDVPQVSEYSLGPFNLETYVFQFWETFFILLMILSHPFSLFFPEFLSFRWWIISLVFLIFSSFHFSFLLTYWVISSSLISFLNFLLFPISLLYFLSLYLSPFSFFSLLFIPFLSLFLIYKFLFFPLYFNL